MPSSTYITLPPVDFVKLIRRGKSYTIRFQHPYVKDGKRVSFSLGNIPESEAKKKQIDIHQEIISHRFILEKYSRKEAKEKFGGTWGELDRAFLGISDGELIRQPKKVATLKDVLANFKKRRNKFLSPTTIKNHQSPLDRFLEANPQLNNISNYSLLIPALKRQYSTSTIIGMWDSYLSRAMYYAELDDLNIPSNKLKQQFGLLQQQKPTPRKKDCYSYPEIEDIILPRLEQHFSVESVIYKATQINYLLGLRPSENLAIQAETIINSRITIDKVKPRGSKTLYYKTKTKKTRSFIISSRVQAILDTLPKTGYLYRLKGKPLSQRVLTHAWDKVITELVAEDRLTRKLPFRTLRHSFINHQLYKPNPLTPVEVAAIVGNSPSTIESNYLVQRELTIAY
ncbi:MAG: hypothetical protein AAF383_06540 [Cyanobacteria bacterium P01_A01_bin.83]